MWSALITAPLAEFAGFLHCPERPMVLLGMFSPILALAVVAIRGRRRWHIEAWTFLFVFLPSFFWGFMQGASLFDFQVFTR
jgi:hypothetical protein